MAESGHEPLASLRSLYFLTPLSVAEYGLDPAGALGSLEKDWKNECWGLTGGLAREERLGQMLGNL